MEDFEAEIKAAAWPTHEPQLYYSIGEFHQQRADELEEAAHTSYTVFRPQFAQALQGQAGDALLTAHDENVALWQKHAQQHRAAAAAANEVGREHEQLRYELGLLIDEGQPKYDKAVQEDEPAAAVQIFAGYRAEAVALAGDAAGRITGVLGTNPLAPVPGQRDSKRNSGSSDKDGKKPDDKGDPDKGAADASKNSQPPGADQPTSPAVSTPDASKNSQPSIPAPEPAPSPTPASPLGGSSGSGASSAMSGVGSAGGLGSSVHPPSMPSAPISALSSGLTSPGLTSPASVASQASSIPRAGGGVPNVAGAFSSGLQSGLGAPVAGAGAGAAAPPASVSPYAAPLAPFASAQPAVAAPVMSGPVSAADAAPAAAGPAVGSSGVAGAPMMAAPIGQSAMAPYSVPGAGAAATQSGVSASPSVPAAAAASAGGGAPLLAGTSATSAGVAASGSEPDVNLIRARAVLEDLVRGSELAGLRSPMAWAVAVVEAATIPQIVIANNVGGGGYIPATVYLAVGARLAVWDPVLPHGWADDLVGWQRPTSVIERWYEQMREAPVYGVRVLAVATTEMWPKHPNCGGSFSAVTDRDILHHHGEAPQLDGWHQHRLAVIDPGLRSRLDALISSAKPEVRAQLQRDLAMGVTGSVLAAAAEPDDTGHRLALPVDEQLWRNVAEAGDADWEAWARESDEVRDLPEIHAPQDLDDSAASRAARVWYVHWYRSARIAELLQCWQPDERRAASSIYDAVYCAMAAGFADRVASVVSDIERRYTR